MFTYDAVSLKKSLKASQGIYGAKALLIVRDHKHMGESVEERVRKALEELRPNLQADGGDVQLVAVDKGIVKVKLKGACAGCPMSTMTVQWGIENFLKKKIPEITKVEAVQ